MKTVKSVIASLTMAAVVAASAPVFAGEQSPQRALTGQGVSTEGSASGAVGGLSPLLIAAAVVAAGVAIYVVADNNNSSSSTN